MHTYFCCMVLVLAVSSSTAMPAEFSSSYSTRTISSPFVLTAKTSTATSDPSSDSIKRLEPFIVGSHGLQKRDACFCTYEYQNTNISAYTDGKKLLFGSNVKKGDTARITCLDKTAILIWRNGLRVSGPVSLTCNTCQTWDAGNMPSCVPLDEGNTWIVLNQQMKLLSDGTVEIRQNEYVRIQCSTVEIKRHIRYPEWRSSSPKSVDVIYNTALIEQGIELKAFLHIDDFQADLTGRYECSAKGVSGQLHGATILNLKIGPPEVRCPILDKKGIFLINYSNGRKVNSTAVYFCRKRTQSTTGGNVRTCLDSGEWTREEDPSCIDISCPKFRADRYLDTRYTNEQYVGSVATFLCRYPQRVFGSSTSTCLRNGTWSHSQPTCQSPSRHFRCPLIYEKDVFIISYSNGRNINSVAYYNCKRISQKIHGSNTRTCEQNGEWSGSDPVCVEPEIRCPAIEEKGIFTIRYNKDRIVGSAAYYSCREPGQNITSSDVRICQDNGNWSGIEPECVASGCEMEDLMASLPTDSVPNKESDIGELLPPVFELNLCNASEVAMRSVHPFPTNTNSTRGLPDSWNLTLPPPA